MSKVRVRKSLKDWPEWLRPYVKKREFKRRKNQYSSDKTSSVCYSVGVVPFDLMVINLSDERYLKWRISGVCKKCGLKFEILWNNLWNRKRFSGEEVCGKCTRNAQYTDEWRKNNSDAQKIAQGSKEARNKMSERIKGVHKEHPELGKKISRGLKKAYRDNPELRIKISKASKKSWEDTGRQESSTGHGYHSGYFVSKHGDIFFASSWELMFLNWCSKNENVSSFKRCNDRIKYLKPSGGTSFYLPDFLVRFLNGSWIVVEIKGGRSDIDLVERKRKAALDFYGSSGYVVFYGDDLKNMGIFIESRKVKDWILKLEGEGLVKDYAKSPKS